MFLLQFRRGFSLGASCPGGLDSVVQEFPAFFVSSLGVGYFAGVVVAGCISGESLFTGKVMG